MIHKTRQLLNVHTNGLVEPHQTEVWLHSCRGWVHYRSSRHTEWSSSIILCFTKSNRWTDRTLAVKQSSGIRVEIISSPAFFLMKEAVWQGVKAGGAGGILNLPECVQRTVTGQLGWEHGASLGSGEHSDYFLRKCPLENVNTRPHVLQWLFTEDKWCATAGISFVLQQMHKDWDIHAASNITLYCYISYWWEMIVLKLKM